MQERRYREVHLGPFFRWLRTAKVFELVSEAELRQVFADLLAMDAVRIEERDTGEGYPFSVASLNYNHPLVRKMNTGRPGSSGLRDLRAVLGPGATRDAGRRDGPRAVRRSAARRFRQPAEIDRRLQD